MPPETLADLIASIGITPPQTPQQRFYQRPRLPGDALMQPGDVQPAAPSQIGGYLIDRSLARHADQEAQRGAQIMQRNGVDPTGNAPRSLPQVLGDVGNMAFEGTGLPAAKRAIQHTYNSMQMGVGDQSMAEARAGTDNALMAGLNVAMLAGPHMLPELPARRLPLNAAQQAQVADAGLGGMFDEAGSLASPEQALGRPLTPDHIWNDPRFAERMAATSHLEGTHSPAERFRIAAAQEATKTPVGRAGLASNDVGLPRRIEAARDPSIGNPPPDQTRTVKQNFPADERRGLRSYQSQNVDVTIERKSGDAAAHVGWALRGQPPQSLAARAQLEQEGIAASVDALKQDAAANPRAAYKFQGFNQALMRRYRRIVDEHAASAGFDVSMEDGSLVLRRKPASQSNPPNGGGSDPAKPPDPALPPQRRPRT